MAHFCALLSIDFKVCRLITETVSDHIRKTVTNRLCFPPLFQSFRGNNQEVLWQRVQAALFHTLHYMTAQDIAVDILKWKDMFDSPWRQEKSSYYFAKNWWNNQSCLTSLRGNRLYRPSPGSATNMGYVSVGRMGHNLGWSHDDGSRQFVNPRPSAIQLTRYRMWRQYSMLINRNAFTDLRLRTTLRYVLVLPLYIFF